MSKSSQELYYLYVLTALEEKKKKLEEEINRSIFPNRSKKKELEQIEQLLNEKLTYFASITDAS